MPESRRCSSSGVRRSATGRRIRRSLSASRSMRSRWSSSAVRRSTSSAHSRAMLVVWRSQRASPSIADSSPRYSATRNHAFRCSNSSGVMRSGTPGSGSRSRSSSGASTLSSALGTSQFAIASSKYDLTRLIFFSFSGRRPLSLAVGSRP